MHSISGGLASEILTALVGLSAALARLAEILEPARARVSVPSQLNAESGNS